MKKRRPEISILETQQYIETNWVEIIQWVLILSLVVNDQLKYIWLKMISQYVYTLQDNERERLEIKVENPQRKIKEKIKYKPHS